MPEANDAITSFENTERALEAYQGVDFTGADPAIIKQALSWVTHRDLEVVAADCGIDDDQLTRNMMSPLFMALVHYFNEKQNQPDIVGRAWLQVEYLKLEKEIRDGTVEEKTAKLRLQTLKALGATLPRRETLELKTPGPLGRHRPVTIDSTDFQDDAPPPDAPPAGAAGKPEIPPVPEGLFEEDDPPPELETAEDLPF